MFTCIDCGQALTRKQSEYGIFWACEGCGRWLLAIPLLRGLLETEFFNRFWQAVRSSGEGAEKPCSACNKSLNRISLGTPEAPLEPLVCKNCNNAWFTPAERVVLPVKPSLQAAAAPKAPPSEAAKAAAMMQVQMIAERAHNENRFDYTRIPLWKRALCVLGMPFELDGMENPDLPWATLLLALSILVFSVNSIPAIPSKPSALALIPSDAGRNGGLAFLFNFLVHSGWFQLAGNLYFLFLFGRGVEGKVQWGGLAALFLFSNLAGNLTALCLDPRSPKAILGANGGVAGILLFYAFVFPHRRLVFYFFRKFIPIPAWAFLGIWVLFQMLGALAASTVAGGISYACSFGGLLGGLMGWLFWRWRQKAEAKALK